MGRGMHRLRDLQYRFNALRTIDILRNNADHLAELLSARTEQADVINATLAVIRQAIEDMENLA